MNIAWNTVSLNRGVNELEVDLPLMSSEQVVPDGTNTGRLSIVLKGEDLAGNALRGVVRLGKQTIWQHVERSAPGRHHHRR